MHIETSCQRSGDCELPSENSLSLETVFLHVTKACNLSCAYCYFSAQRPMREEMSAAEYESFWPQVVQIRPRKLVFTGGEPLLRRDLAVLLRGFRYADPDHRTVCCLNTNGHFVTAAIAGELVGLVDEVRVSVDAFAPRNDALRGTGSFDAAIRALEICREADLNPRVLVTVTGHTLPDLEQFVVYLIKRGFGAINIHWFWPIGRGRGHDEWRVTGTAIKESIHRAFAHLGASAARPSDSDETEPPRHCGFGRYLNVMPNGDVFPCHVPCEPEFCCGNVQIQNLTDICRSGGLLETKIAGARYECGSSGGS